MKKSTRIKEGKYSKEGIWLNLSYMLIRQKEKVSEQRHEIFVRYCDILDVHRSMELLPPNWIAISVFNTLNRKVTTRYKLMSIKNFIDLINTNSQELLVKIKDNIGVNLTKIRYRNFNCSELFVNEDIKYSVSEYFRPIVKKKFNLITDE